VPNAADFLNLQKEKIEDFAERLLKIEDEEKRE